ncbi:hypothetical protein UT300002_27180 [Clostridium perfringens]
MKIILLGEFIIINIVKKDNEELNKKYIDVDKIINKQNYLEYEDLEKCLKK